MWLLLVPYLQAWKPIVTLCEPASSSMAQEEPTSDIVAKTNKSEPLLQTGQPHGYSSWENVDRTPGYSHAPWCTQGH